MRRGVGEGARLKGGGGLANKRGRKKRHGRVRGKTKKEQEKKAAGTDGGPRGRWEEEKKKNKEGKEEWGTPYATRGSNDGRGRGRRHPANVAVGATAAAAVLSPPCDAAVPAAVPRRAAAAVGGPPTPRQRRRGGSTRRQPPNGRRPGGRGGGGAAGTGAPARRRRLGRCGRALAPDRPRGATRRPSRRGEGGGPRRRGEVAGRLHTAGRGGDPAPPPPPPPLLQRGGEGRTRTARRWCGVCIRLRGAVSGWAGGRGWRGEGGWGWGYFSSCFFLFKGWGGSGPTRHHRREGGALGRARAGRSGA